MPRLSPLLFILSTALAAGLMLLVLLAPLLDKATEASSGWGQVLQLFARDAPLRRTSVVSAIGLVVTACVFFRPPRLGRQNKPLRRPPANIIGA